MARLGGAVWLAAWMGASTVRADLPVHCMGDEFLGTWEVKMTLPSEHDLFAMDEGRVCGHSRPDDFTLSMREDDRFDHWWLDRASPEIKSAAQEAPFLMCIPHANGTHAELCRGPHAECGSSSCEPIDFTLVYDEAFLLTSNIFGVKVKAVGLFQYEPKTRPQAAPGPTSFPEVSNIGMYKSLCGETITSVYSARGDEVQRDGKYYRGCFIARKTARVSTHSSEMRPGQNGSGSSSSSVVSPTSLLQLQTTTLERGMARARARAETRARADAQADLDAFLNSKVAFSSRFVESLNSRDLGWTASVDSASVFADRTHRDALQHLGVRMNGQSASMMEQYMRAYARMEGRAVEQEFERSDEALGASMSSKLSAKETKKMEAKALGKSLELKVVESKDEKDDDVDNVRCALEHLPPRFDWTNATQTQCSGIVSDATNQGSCGSCYTMSAAHAASSRLRIAFHPDEECRSGPQSLPDVLQTTLSPQTALQCSYVNQGCGGGYPILAAFHAYAEGWVDTECDPYVGDSSGTCPAHPGCKRYYPTDFSYSGGRYGYKSDVASIMEDLIEYGPVGVAIIAPPALQVYKSGVFVPIWDEKKETITARHSFWQKTNHAVLLVGYDVLDVHGKKVPVWKIQNSWGPQWGEDGFFYVSRGEDSISVESMPASIRFTDGPASRVGSRLLAPYKQCMKKSAKSRQWAE